MSKDNFAIDTNNVQGVAQLPPTEELSIEEAFRDLFEISPELREKMRGKSLGLIIFESSISSLQLTREGDRLSRIEKQTSTQDLYRIVQKQIESYNRSVQNIFIPSTEGLLELLKMISPEFQFMASALEYSLKGADRSLENEHQASNTSSEHLKRTAYDLLEELKRTHHDHGSSRDRILEVWKQIMQQEYDANRSITT